MTDTTTVDDTSEDALPELEESEYIGADAPSEDTPLKMRLLLPILVPLLSIAIVAVLVLNISRVFLADDKNVALGLAIGITLTILIGASIIAAFPRLKTTSLAVILGVTFLFVSLAGLVSLGSSLNDGEGAGTSIYATGKATSTVSVTAGPSLSFNGVKFTGQYSATAGIVQIDYGGDSGHTLAIQDPKYQAFLLQSSAGGRKSGKIDLPAGTYTIYCTVTGHEAAGMKATLTVK